MKTTLHNFISTIKCYKTSSLINIVGLTLAFASFYIIMVQISYEFNFNKAIKDSDRIFRIETLSGQNGDRFSYRINRPMGEDLIKSSHIIETGGTYNFRSRKSNICISRNDNIEEYQVLVGDISLSSLDLFSFEKVDGNLADLGTPQSIAISKSAAKRLALNVGDMCYFGTPNPKSAFSVVAIFNDFPINSDLGKTEVVYDLGDENIEVPNLHYYAYYVKIKPDADITDLHTSAQKALEQAFLRVGATEEEAKEALEMNYFRFLPITKSYFTTDINYAVNEMGNKATSYCLLAIAIFVIAIALINFINFFFALVPIRIRAVNTYKIFGSSTSALRLGFVLEAIGLVTVALVLAAILVNLLGHSSFAGYISTSLQFSSNQGITLLTIACALFTAIASSLYPAYYITSFPTAMVLKGSFASSKAGQHLRYALIGFQFVVSISLIIATSFVKLQHIYMKNYDMGFNSTNLLSAAIPQKISSSAESREAFRAHLLKNPQITDMTWAASPMVAENRMGVMREVRGDIKTFSVYSVTWDFLNFMGIEMVEGRNFNENDEQVTDHGMLIFNHQSKADLDIVLEDRVKWVNTSSYTEIIGFCKDFNSKPLHYGYSPIAFMVYSTDHDIWNLRHIYVRIDKSANPAEVINYVRSAIIKFEPTVNPNYVSVVPFGDEITPLYEKEHVLTILISAFTLLSVIISLMGVFGLVMFETQHRRKEIGLRRVHGASIKEILVLFNNKFITIVAICFAIAIPISYYFIDRWLDTFFFRTPIYWWVFALSFLLIFVITVATVTIRSLKAATSNPSESIKTE